MNLKKLQDNSIFEPIDRQSDSLFFFDVFTKESFSSSNPVPLVSSKEGYTSFNDAFNKAAEECYDVLTNSKLKGVIVTITEGSHFTKDDLFNCDLGSDVCDVYEAYLSSSGNIVLV